MNESCAGVCGVLQCVVVCFGVLQCAAVYCSPHVDEQRVTQTNGLCALVCSVLQCVIVCCSVLQCVAVCCSVLSQYIPRPLS